MKKFLLVSILAITLAFGLSLAPAFDTPAFASISCNGENNCNTTNITEEFNNYTESKTFDNPYGGGVDVLFYLGKYIGYDFWKPDAIKYEYRYDHNNGAHTNNGVLVFEFGK
jgi:opacity protein-like surface antigen